MVEVATNNARRCRTEPEGRQTSAGLQRLNVMISAQRKAQLVDLAKPLPRRAEAVYRWGNLSTESIGGWRRREKAQTETAAGSWSSTNRLWMAGPGDLCRGGVDDRAATLGSRRCRRPTELQETEPDSKGDCGTDGNRACRGCQMERSDGEPRRQIDCKNGRTDGDKIP